MNANIRRDIELLLSHMPDNGFLQGLLNRLRVGVGLTSNQLTALDGMKSRMAVQRALIERDKANDLKISVSEKKASVSRCWDYDRGEWAYRVGGGKIKYASEEQE